MQVAQPAYEDLAEFVLERTGIVLDTSSDAARFRIRKAVAATRSADVADLLQVVRSDANELHTLIELLVVGETYFLRHPEQIAFLREFLLPDLLERSAGRRLRVWSAGCSTGEEAYTLAVLLTEAALDAGFDAGFDVIGTDLSDAHVGIARKAEYRVVSRGRCNSTVLK